MGEQRNAAGAADLLNALAHDDDCDVRQRCDKVLEKRLASYYDVTVKSLPTEIGLLSKAEHQAGVCQSCSNGFRSHTTIAVNPQELARFGADLTALATAGALPHAFKVEQPLRMLLDLLQRERVRSVALPEKSSAGKSSLVNELVYARSA